MTDDIVDEEVEILRAALIPMIDELMRRGFSPTRAGALVAADAGFIFKLKRGHRFRLVTLLKAKEAALTALASTPEPLPSFLQDTA